MKAISRTSIFRTFIYLIQNMSSELKLFVDVVANQPETQKASMEMRKAKQLGT